MAIGVHIWKSLPFWTLILMTGRLAISHDLFEAADVDGASWWQKFRFITWPSMQTLYLTCTLLSMIWTLGDFNSVYLLTGGGPADLTHVLSTLGIRYLRLDQLEPRDGVDRLRAAVRAAAGLFHDETVVAMKLPTLARSRHRSAAVADRHSRVHLDHDSDLPHVPVRDLAEGRRVLRQTLARPSDAEQFPHRVLPGALFPARFLDPVLEFDRDRGRGRRADAADRDRRGVFDLAAQGARRPHG